MPTNLNTLLDACDHGRVEVIKQAIEEGIDINQGDSGRWNPLLCAARAAQTDAVDALLKAGADVSYSRGGGFNALHMAVAAANEKRDAAGVTATVAIAKLLLAKGTDPSAPTEQTGQTPMRNAACFVVPELFEVLVNAEGVDVNVRAKDGTTPMISAVAGSQPSDDKLKILQLLLTKGADVTLADGEGYTALHFAAGAGDLAVVDWLLEQGADPAAATTKASASDPSTYPAGLTVAAYARIMKKDAVAEHLESR